MKKSQLYSQIFIYILTIFLIAIIFVFGYNTILNFKKRAEQVSCIKFKTDLQNAIKSITSDFGSVIRKDLQLCGNYKKVCFVESFEAFDVDKLPSSIDPIIIDSIKYETGKNVFLVEDIAKESFYAGKISVNPDVLCIKAVDDKISLRLEGKGNYVLLSNWG